MQLVGRRTGEESAQFEHTDTRILKRLKLREVAKHPTRSESLPSKI
jgi:hypothetical protein